VILITVRHLKHVSIYIVKMPNGKYEVISAYRKKDADKNPR
jgi:hypothetical protein